MPFAHLPGRILLLISACAGGVFATDPYEDLPGLAQQEPVDVPHIDGLTIDGKPDDWGDRGLRLDALAAADGTWTTADFHPQARLGWNEQGIVALLTVVDPDADEQVSGPGPFGADGAALFLSDRQRAVQLITTVGRSADRLTWLCDVGIGKDRTEMARSVAVVHDAKGWTMELLLPWQALQPKPTPADQAQPATPPLAPTTPTLGAVFAMQVEIDDRDGPKNAKKLRRACWYPGCNTWVSPVDWMRIRLAEQPAMAQRVNAALELPVAGPASSVPQVRITSTDSGPVTVAIHDRIIATGQAVAGEPLILPLAPVLPGIGASGLEVRSGTARMHLYATGNRLAMIDRPIGPLIGDTTPTSARVWAWIGGLTDVTVRVRSELATIGEFPLIPNLAEGTPLSAGATFAALSGLLPNTRYQISLMHDGVAYPSGEGRFRTPPLDGTRGITTFATASCMDLERVPTQPGWWVMRELDPAFVLLLGDNVYANSTDPAVQWPLHLRQRCLWEFAALARSTVISSIWDDHDYGPNDALGTEPGKERSLAAFTQLFPNPPMGLPENPGVFHRFRWGDVEVFQLDDRWYREANQPDHSSALFGDAQMGWLKHGLATSTATFKIIGTGSTLSGGIELISNTPMNGGSDSGATHRREIESLYAWIRDQHISGIVVCSGDVHRSYLVEHRPDETGGALIPELISSGIGRPAGGVFVGSFISVQIDTTLADPTFTAHIHWSDATIRSQQTWKLSQLTPP